MDSRECRFIVLTKGEREESKATIGTRNGGEEERIFIIFLSGGPLIPLPSFPIIHFSFQRGRKGAPVASDDDAPGRAGG